MRNVNMQNSTWIDENPEKALQPINGYALTTAIQANKLRDSFESERIARKIDSVLAFPYIGYQENAQYRYLGDKNDEMMITDFDGADYCLFIQGSKGNLIKLFIAAGLECIGDVNNLDMFKEMTDKQFAVFVQFGRNIQTMIDSGQVEYNPKKKKVAKTRTHNVVISSVKASKKSAQNVVVKSPKKAKAFEKMTKAELVALVQANAR